MEMYADPTARGGVLEPEATVEIKYRARLTTSQKVLLFFLPFKNFFSNLGLKKKSEKHLFVL